MRVLALATDAFGGRGGIAQYNRNFISALAEAGAQVSVLPRIGKADELPPGVTQSSPRLSPVHYSAHALACAVRHRAFDIIWCGHLFMAPLAQFIGRLTGPPVWLQVHGIDAWDAPSPTLKSAADASRMITAVSRYTRRRLLEWSDIPPERVRVLQNCVQDSFSPGPKPSDLAARYGIGRGPVLLTLSRLASSELYKGHDRVICNLPNLVKRFPDLVYVVAGEGDDRARLESLAENLGVAGHCRFIGFVPDDDKVNLYRLADLFVMPSINEGFGIVYLEAMACGVPAVGLNVDGSVDPLTTCDLGHAIPEDRLGETIANLLSNPPRRPTEIPADLAPFSRANFARRVRTLAEEIVCSNSVKVHGKSSTVRTLSPEIVREPPHANSMRVRTIASEIL